METAIRTTGLTKKYGHHQALHGIDLEVPTGVVFGYLGPNGAGKTTTIRIIVGLLRPTAGAAEVCGLDTVRRREDMQRRIGYLPGNFVGYADLTAQKYLRYLAGLRGGVSWTGVEDLAIRLDLDLGRRIGALSHGNRQKVGIVQALMHDPAVLVLDEPTSGLDPLAQRQFLDLVREARQRGRTVFLSSHILSEVENVADMVGILRDGRLMVVDSVDVLKARALRRIDLTFETTVPGTQLSAVAGVRDVHVVEATAQVTVEGSTAGLFRVAAPYGLARVVSHEPDLEEIFMTYYGGKD